MKCKKSKEKIILYLYGELSESEKADLENHVKTCPACKEDFEYTKKVFQLIDDSKEDSPAANWDKCWREIGVGVQAEPRTRKSFFLAPRWVYAAAGMLFIFILGAFIGRYLFFAPQQSTVEEGISETAMKLKLNSYIDELKPILIEYANYAASEDKDTMIIEKDIVRSLLIQNFLLKDLVARSDPSLLPFLEDLDIVLKELSNMQKGDELTPSMIKELIHEREILFKMEILQTM